MNQIQSGDHLVDWREKFNRNATELENVKKQLDQLQTGSQDNEVIALRTSEVFGETYPSADARVEATEQRIQENQNRIKTLEGKAYPVVNVKQFGAVGDGSTDDTQAIQSALDLAHDINSSGVEIFVPDGEYMISTPLIIYSRTRLHLSKGAVIVRKASPSPANMLRSAAGGGGYEGQQNIEVVGGTWDGNASSTTTSTLLSFAHCRNVVIRDTTVKNWYENHALELNGVQGGKVLNCFFQDHLGGGLREAIQIDLMKSSAQYPWYGPYDNTPCDDILIEGCTFVRCVRGVGSHSSTPGVLHTNIQIQNNHFKDLTNQAIRGMNYDNCVISGNVMENVGMGIEFKTNDTTCGNSSISGNVVKGTNRTTTGDGIWVLGENSKAYIKNVSVTGNTIENSSQHGIRLENVRKSVVDGNSVDRCRVHGIGLDYVEDTVVSNNMLHEYAWKRGTPADGIQLYNQCKRNLIQGNLCRAGKSTDAEYGIDVVGSKGSTHNAFLNNDVYASGYDTADKGLDARKPENNVSSGNRLNDNTIG